MSMQKKRERKNKASLLLVVWMLSNPGFLSAQEKAAPIETSAVSSPAAVSTARAPELETSGSGVRFIESIQDSQWLKSIEMEKGEIPLVSGRSQLIRLDRQIARVSVSNPAIVDAVIISPNEILLNAKSEGSVNVIFWDHQNRVSVYDISVTKDPNLLQALLRKISPESDLEVFPSRDVYVVKGSVDSVIKQKEVEQAANAFAEGSVSLVRVDDAKQILLKTRFIQLDHAQNYDFGLDVQYLGRNFGPLIRPGGTGATLDDASPFTPRNSVVSYNTFSEVPSASGVHWFPYFTRDRGVNTFLKAVESKGIGKIIARPNLLASDGQEASFLVGGEAAVVAISNDNVGVQYKEFGTRLTFLPEILPSGRIRLTVAPEVSALDFANGVSVNNITIPSFTTVRTKTVVELEDNETFMIGGLLQQKITVDERGVPFLRRMPLIGKLFDNTNNSYSDSELLVVVTPMIVDPIKEPLSEDEKPDGLIERATQMQPYRVRDKNMEAIDEYLRENRKELQDQIKKFQQNQPAEIKKEPVIVKTAPPVVIKTEVPEVSKQMPQNSEKKSDERIVKKETAPPAASAASRSVKTTSQAVPPRPPSASAEKAQYTPSGSSIMTASRPQTLEDLEAQLAWQESAKKNSAS